MKTRRGVKKPTSVEFSPGVKERVLDRSGGYCERCRLAFVQTYHHKKLRSQGGRGTFENCLGLCNPCHTWIHLNTGEAYKRGWLVKSWDDGSAA